MDNNLSSEDNELSRDKGKDKNEDKTCHGKARQDKTRHDKTRQEKTRQDKARQGKTTQHRQDKKTTQDNARHKTATRQGKTTTRQNNDKTRRQGKKGHTWWRYGRAYSHHHKTAQDNRCDAKHRKPFFGKSTTGQDKRLLLSIRFYLDCVCEEWRWWWIEINFWFQTR